MKGVLISFAIAILSVVGYIYVQNNHFNADHIFCGVLIISLTTSLLLCKK